MSHGDERDQMIDNVDGIEGQQDGGIAIIGMSGRFPGAPSVDALWKMVSEGRDAFQKFAPEEIEDAFTDAERADENYIAARPHVDSADMFDAEFFGMFPKEAAITDPQHRIFLEICWEALESAGCDPSSYTGMVGVFAGASMPTYLINNVLSDRAKAEEFTSNYQVGTFNQLVGSLSDTLATKVAYKLNLRGPAFTIQSACSTSLLAVAQACQNLLTYSCDMALAGGISVTFPQKRGYMYQQGGMVSPDGTCRPFDENAAGTVFSSGAGVVLLKRVEDALRDEDRIYAVIRGYGVNNDGSNKVGFTAPSVEGQAEAIASAMANAGIDPSTIGYLECHGTATPLGDPIEFGGLKNAFADIADMRRNCALGSLKGNIGHMDAAAGVSGLIKAALALQHAKIPGMANYATPNPRIDLDGSPFYIPTEMVDWPVSATPRRAGVSSFGVGGTNVHVVLEETPTINVQTKAGSVGPYILPLSARNNNALSDMRANLADYLSEQPDISMPRLAHTLQNGRKEFNNRLAFSVSNVEDAIERLRAERLQPVVAANNPPPIAFMFPGQGAQYVGMGAALYRSEPQFAQWIDRGAEIVKMQLGLDLRDYICHSGPVSPTMADEQRETRIAQPCLYLVEYAMARLWLSRGVKPFAMIGHSVGEFVAATIANVISFEDALRLVVARGRLMQGQPEGAMVSVRADAKTVSSHLQDGVEIAAINAPKLCVISGPFAAIDAICASLAKAEIAFSKLHTSHAFHSPMMDNAAEALRDETARVTYGTATIPYISGVTGDWQTGERGVSPEYWARHCRETVHFSDGLQALCRDRKPVLMEIGPGRALSVFASQTISRDGVAAIIQTLPEHDRASAAAETLADATGKLWMAGCEIEWPALGLSSRIPLSLPTYPFQRKRHWIDAPPPARRLPTQQASPEQIPPEQPIVSLIQPVDEIKAMNVVTPVSAMNRIPALETSLLSLLSEMSGEALDTNERAATFLELGFDSLFIGQFAQRIEKTYKVKLSFRELLSNITNVVELAQHLDQEMAPEPAAMEPVAIPQPAMAMQPSVLLAATPSMPQAIATPMIAPAVGTGFESVMQSQLQLVQSLFSQQLQAMQSLNGGVAQALPAIAPPVASSVSPIAVQQPTISNAAPPATAQPVEAEIGAARIKLYRPGVKSQAEITPEKQKFIAELVSAYGTKHTKSKAFANKYRPQLADPRTAAGFRADWKEMVFPIVSDRSKGSRIWDVDGNEYIDLVNGFGQTAFGHAPDFVLEAMRVQMEAGYAIGPQSPLAGEVADMICEMTGHERMTFCNTGSEAMMAAMRVARSVTGRDRVVMFANDYHGQFDEVLVKGRNGFDRPVALPIASGIPASSVGNMVVLPYGAPGSLEWIRANADSIAATIIEPIQSRHPQLQPIEFVRELRDIATECDFALVFDEVVTGFRVDPGGIQALWGIRGDLAAYGKVAGGGMPIGILAGDARYMDALDGGRWNYGDDSVPMTAPTFFAGTFVRHPIVLAACHAILHHIKGDGAVLYGRVAERTQQLVAEINTDLAARGIGSVVHGYKSWFYADFSSDPLGALMYPLLRQRGIHVQEHYPCFLTTTHSEADFQAIAAAFRDSAAALQSVGILATVGAQPVQVEAVPAPAAARLLSAPLTEAQTEVWLAAQAGDEASCAFNESFSLTLEGAFNETAFLKAIDTVVARHDALHIRFDRTGKQFEFLPDFKLETPIMDLSTDADGEARLSQLLDDEARTPFDLVDGPLVRTSIVCLTPEKHVFVFTAHHIICDGWSINVFIEELATAYSAILAGGTPEFQPALSYASYSTDFAPKAEASGKTEAFWLDCYKDVPELPEFPLDRPRPERRTFAGGTRTGFIDAETYKALKKAGAKSGATLFSTLLATLQVMVSKLSGQNDIVIAVPSAGQTLIGDRILMGHCVNLLPVRQDMTSADSFRKHLKTTQQNVLQVFEHQDYTYGTLVRKLGIKRDARRLPLTEIQFNLERVGSGAGFGSLKSSVEPNAKAFANFDMFLNMIEGADGIRIDVDYNADVFNATTIDRWIGHFKTLAGAVAADMGRAIRELPMLHEKDTNWIVNDLNQTASNYDHHEFAFTLFSRKAAEQPDAVAAEFAGNSLTYKELDDKSNQLALYLQMKMPEPGQRVGLLVDRSLDMLVSLLAIMKAGHAYVPMDPSHPESRLRQTFDLVRMGGMVCDSEQGSRLAPADLPVIRLDEDAKAIASMTKSPLGSLPTDTKAPAYIILTSGSTGLPKGVEVPHQALTNFLLSMAREPGFTAKDTIVAVTTISFDIAALEMYLPLISGGKVVIATKLQVQDGFALVKLIEDCGASVMQATPTLWTMMLEAGLRKNSNLKMLCGGEPLPKDLAKSLLTIGSELWNMYGPTETTIWSSIARITDAAQPITIGQPIANTQLYILDAENNVAPIGVTGELHIGGDGLANGYFDRLDLTEKAFVPISLGSSKPKRLYKTGDVGRRLVDGSLQLLGRRDQQIKLRGFRIELGDIESVVSKMEGVRQCAVVAAANDKGDKSLVCYVVPAVAGSEISPVALSTHAQAHLPGYMVPTFWVTEEDLPQTQNGKLNRKNLEDRGVPARETNVIKLAPRNATEEKLMLIWRDVLNLQDMGVDDNLYALGADSLTIFRLAARMIDAGLPLEAKHLLRHPSINELAKFVEQQGDVKGAATQYSVPSLRDFRNGARRGVRGAL